jgi:hypothetical protein
MSHDLKMFLILYGISLIPYFVSLFVDSKDGQLGLFFIDLGLTIAAYVFLWNAIGWWVIPVSLCLAGVGYVIKSLGIRPYSLIDKS